MKISIIIPVYNVERYLEKCLDSVINQSYLDLEIILVNDGATDNSKSICESYLVKDSRIQLINKRNGGLSDARNAGLKVATGAYVWFVDSDDWIAENAISILVEAIQLNNCEVIGFSFFDYFEDTHQYSEVRYSQQINKTTGRDFINQCTFFYTGAWSYIYKKSFLDATSITFKLGQLHEDDYFNLSCFGRIKEIVKIPNGLYFYRRRENSITTTTTPQNLAKRIYSYIELLKLCKNINDIDQEYLLSKAQAYKRILFSLIEHYVLSKDVSFKDKITLVANVKPFMRNLQLEKNNFNHSKKNWLNQILFNKSNLLYVLTLQLFKK